MDEKRTIEAAANRYGGSVSQYVREKILSQSESKAECGKERQEIVKCLCQHAHIIEKLCDPELIDILEEWEKSIWQVLK